ncbi:MAG TPA: glycosyltransferase [Terriglobales bacterium]|nr:glycosyltransferase [Terriglobales bacterium]
MKIFVFGSSITSSYWNGAATYYRGIYRNLALLGHEITFAEPDVYGRQQHRDPADYSYVESVVYSTPGDLPAMFSRAAGADLIIKHSGVGADDPELECAVARDIESDALRAFWDVDAPATLSRIETEHNDPFRPLIPDFDFIFTYGGGPPVIEHYLHLGARNCDPIYNALDPETHFPVSADFSLECDLVLVANRLPDREQRVEQFFLRAAELAPDLRFILGGEGWGNKRLPENVRWIGHVATGDHNRVNCSARMVLNLNRDSMASVGFSPPTRVFEAAGAGACLITDAWAGIEQFFEPGCEILVTQSAEEIVRLLRETSTADAERIGAAMRARALRDHTYAQRAVEVSRLLEQKELRSRPTSERVEFARI